MYEYQQSSSIDLAKLIHEKVIFPCVFKFNNLEIRDDNFDYFPSINFDQNDTIYNFTVTFRGYLPGSPYNI